MLKKYLKAIKTAQVRAVFLFDGPTHWLQAHRRAALSHIKDIVHISDKHDDASAMHRYRDYLGNTHHFLLIDFTTTIHADALAALIGTLSGGGVAFVLLPPQDSPFRQRLINTSHKFHHVSVMHPNTSFRQLLTEQLSHSLEPAPPLAFPTREQQLIVQQMVDLPGTCHLLMADRGRGKSTTLGLAAQAWIRSYRGRELVVTGPKPNSVATLLKHAADSVRFVAWDRLLSEYPNQSVRLIIDEAAAIPIHILKQLSERFTVWAIATTVEGYEGCGRGFAVRFVDWLQVRKMCKQHQLSTPVRWAPADTCEPWLNEALLLRNQPSSEFTKVLTSSQVEIEAINARQLTEHQLSEVISLLLEAHYQSSPNDLKLLLDDAQQHLLVARVQGHIVGVVWYSEEGPLPAKLQLDIQTGRRRLHGNILPQAVAFYLQQGECLDWRWWRVTRIAVVKAYRRQRIGRQLLDKLQDMAQQAGIDALGSSFGASPKVLDFWRSSPFELIRLGRKLNMASGYPNALVATGLTPAAALFIAQLHAFSNAELEWRQGRPVTINSSIYRIARDILTGFAFGNLPFTEAQFSWSVCDIKYSMKAAGLTLPGQILKAHEDLAKLTQKYGYSSQQTMQNQLRSLAREYLELSR